jgi:hypothetical protein
VEGAIVIGGNVVGIRHQRQIRAMQGPNKRAGPRVLSLNQLVRKITPHAVDVLAGDDLGQPAARIAAITMGIDRMYTGPKASAHWIIFSD